MLVNGGSLQWLNHFPRDLVMLSNSIHGTGIFTYTDSHNEACASALSLLCRVY